jgi:hypothetical protein
LLQRIGVRYVFVYSTPFCLFTALLSTLAYEIRYGTAPGAATIQQAFRGVWTPTMSWAGAHLFA